MNSMIKTHAKRCTLILVLLISSCTNPAISRVTGNDEPEIEVVYTKPSLTLAWHSDEGSSENSYNVYYKSHGNAYWSLLDRTLNSSPVFTIEYSQLGEGSWDFGVSMVDIHGVESEIHSSLDTTAVPETGWYVTWIHG